MSNPKLKAAKGSFLDGVLFERKRIEDLLLTEPCVTRRNKFGEKQSEDRAIKSDRFKLLTSIRQGKPFAEILAEIDGDFMRGQPDN